MVQRLEAHLILSNGDACKSTAINLDLRTTNSTENVNARRLLFRANNLKVAKDAVCSELSNVSDDTYRTTNRTFLGRF